MNNAKEIFDDLKNEANRLWVEDDLSDAFGVSSDAQQDMNENIRSFAIRNGWYWGFDYDNDGWRMTKPGTPEFRQLYRSEVNNQLTVLRDLRSSTEAAYNAGTIPEDSYKQIIGSLDKATGVIKDLASMFS